jgi:multidrug efflux pump subunit AcrA (membrane-fusion protein)
MLDGVDGWLARRHEIASRFGARFDMEVDALLILALSVLAGCGEKNAYVPPPPPKVVVAQPLQQDVPLYVELTGNTKAFNEVKLEARVQGFLEQIKYVDGATAKAGDTLFVIEPGPYENALSGQGHARSQQGFAGQRPGRIQPPVDAGAAAVRLPVSR